MTMRELAISNKQWAISNKQLTNSTIQQLIG